MVHSNFGIFASESFMFTDMLSNLQGLLVEKYVSRGLVAFRICVQDRVDVETDTVC
jgi:hypothetical protein